METKEQRKQHFRRNFTLLILLAFASYIFYSLRGGFYANGYKKRFSTRNISFSTMLQMQASPERNILLAYADMGALDLAINFYETSIKKYNIESYLFLSSSLKACRYMRKLGIACLKYGNDTASDLKSIYGSKEFDMKCNIRTPMILEALSLGYNILHSDVDVIFVHDAFRDFPCLKGSCDVAFMWDVSVYNAGFFYIRSSPASVRLYKTTQQITTERNLVDQVALNQALKQLDGSIKIIKLPSEKFPCGKLFYEKYNLHHGDDPTINKTSPIVIHNNWIVTIEAKIYRFKEMLQWSYDKDGYYSSKFTKYLSYDNAVVASEEKSKLSWESERNALENALMIATLLNRTLILPKFHCGGHFCSLLSAIKIKNFDQVFEDKYREHLFLRHPKVPQNILHSVSPVSEIYTDNVTSLLNKSFNATVYFPNNSTSGPSDTEILKWFGATEEKILQFRHLNGRFILLRSMPFQTYKSFNEAFSKAFCRCSYIQAARC